MPKAVALGDLLAFSRSSSRELEAWLDGADSKLATKVREEAGRRGESVIQFVRISVADFLAEASEEAWADLMSAVRDAIDPGAACLAKMTAFRVAMEIGG